jgi:hypothetical protein
LRLGVFALIPVRVFGVVHGLLSSLIVLDDSGAALKAASTMNPIRLLAIAMLLGVTCLAQLPPNGSPQPPLPRPGMLPNTFQPPAMQQPMPAKDVVNYVIHDQTRLLHFVMCVSCLPAGMPF